MPPSSRKGWVWTWDRWIPIWNFVHSLPGHWLDAWQFQADLTSKGASCSDLREHRQSWRRPGCPNAGEKRRRCLPSLWKNIQQCWKCLVLTARCHHQVMVCGERVGWREEARRVIIYTTDQVPVTAKPPPADFVISCQTSRFVFPELPQRGRREARRSDFAERWSVPPQHHRLLRLEHCAGGLASWNKQTRAIGLHKTLCRTTPAWATSTTWQRSTVWTWCGRWPGSTWTSTRGSHRSSSTSSSPTTTTSHGTHPDDLYQRGRPDIFRLKQCRGIGNSFEFQTRQHVNRHSMSRWERCTRRSRQASRLRTTRRLPSLFITPAIATAERLKRKGHIEPFFMLYTLNLELCPRRRCRNIPLGTPVTFTVHVTLK